MTLDRYGGGGMGQRGTNLVDILDRVLDKGLVVAGDVRISLANVELLTIRIRLLVCSIDKAEQIGLNWWRYDKSLVHQEEGPDQSETIERLEARIAELEAQLRGQAIAAPEPPASSPAGAPARRRRPTA